MRLDISVESRRKGNPISLSFDAIRRNTYLVTGSFMLACILPIVFLHDLMTLLFALILKNETYSHIPLIPVVSFLLIYVERQSFFPQAAYGWKIGSAILVPGATTLVLTRLNTWHASSANQLSLLVFGLILVWAGAFGLFFGAKAIRAALFPLLFLLFAVPVPAPVLSETILLLQRGSAEATSALFHISGVPVFRQGFDFALPGVTIRVAEECSGIRSTFALLMTAVLAGHFWLRSFTRSFLLCILVFPIAIAKNALRIVVLSCLAVYVDPSFLLGNLHLYGGIPFFVLGLLMMGLVLILLQSLQRRNPMPAN